MLSKPLISSPVVVANRSKKTAKTGEETGGTGQRSETVEERERGERAERGERDRDGLIKVRSSLAALTAQTQTKPSHIESERQQKAVGNPSFQL